MYKKILIATDGSDLSAKAATAAIELAKLAGAELVALTVVRNYVQDYFEGALTLDPERTRQIEAEWRAEAQKLVDAVKAKADAKGVLCAGQVRQSALVAETLIDAARELNCDLIVMASHGRRGFKRVLLGSETQHVLTHSHIPVLVLR